MNDEKLKTVFISSLSALVLLPSPACDSPAKNNDAALEETSDGGSLGEQSDDDCVQAIDAGSDGERLVDLDGGQRVCKGDVDSMGVQVTLARGISLHDFLGFNIFPQVYQPGQGADTYERMLELLADLGVEHLRVPIHWNVIEPSRDEFQPDYMGRTDAFMQKATDWNMRVLLYFHGTPSWQSTRSEHAPFYGEESVPDDAYPPKDMNLYAQRAVQLAQRYRQAIEMFSVWNEPNSPAFWAPPEKAFTEVQLYASLLDTAKVALNEYVPGLPVFTAGMAYYSEMHPSRDPNRRYMLDLLYQEGAFRGIDGVAYHPYFARPEGNDDGDPYDFFSRAGERNSTLREQGAKMIFATEFGWSTYKGPVQEQPVLETPLQQGDYLIRRILLMAALGFDRVYVFTLADLPAAFVDSRDKFYGLVHSPDDPEAPLEPKPGYNALKGFVELVGDYLMPAQVVPIEGAKEGLHAVTFMAGGRLFWAGAMAHDSGPAAVRLCGVTKARLFDTASLAGEERPREVADPSGIELLLDDRLSLVEVE